MNYIKEIFTKIKKIKYIKAILKEIFLLIILFLLGMNMHTIINYLVKWSGNPVLGHPLFLLSAFAVVVHFTVILEDYYPLNRKILFLQFKYEWRIFRKITFPEFIKKVKKFFIKYW